MQPTCYPCDYSTVNEDGQLLAGSSRHAKARTRLNSALSCHSVFHLDQIGELPVVKRVTAPLDVPRAANPVDRTTLNEVVNGAVKRTPYCRSERCQSRWQTVRRSSCRNKVPDGNVSNAPGTRLPLRWKANCPFRCQNKLPVGGLTGSPVAKMNVTLRITFSRPASMLSGFGTEERSAPTDCPAQFPAPSGRLPVQARTVAWQRRL